MRRNVASQVVGAQMITAADGTAFTGSVTCYVTGNGGTQAVGSVGSGACAHEGNGFHTYVPAQAETNYAHAAYTFTGAGAIPATVQVYTRAYDANGVGDTNVTAISGDSAAADNLESYCDGTTPQPVNVTQISGDSAAADNLEAYSDGTTPQPVNVTQISGDSAAADNLEAYCDGTTPQPVNVTQLVASAANAVKLGTAVSTEVTGTVDDASFTPTTTQFRSDNVNTNAADHYNGRMLIFTSGTLQNQACRILDYSSDIVRGHFTVTALTSAPANDVTFIIV